MQNQTEREYARKAQKQAATSKQELINFLNAFLNESIGKNETQVKELYTKYEAQWQRFAKEHNEKNETREDKNQVVTAFEDAFESAVNNARTRLKGQQCPKGHDMQKYLAHKNEFMRVLRIVEYKTWLGKISYWLSKHFFVKSHQYKWNGELKPQLTVVKEETK